MKRLTYLLVLLLALPAMALDCTWEDPVIVGTVAASTSPTLNEASGLVQSRLNADVLWSHQDNSNDERLFALNVNGAYLATYDLAVPAARDPEDIAMGPGPVAGTNYIYYGDVGHNDGIWGCKAGGTGCAGCAVGKNCTERNPRVWRTPEPAVDPAQAYVAVTNHPAITLEFSFPDVMIGKQQDIETLMVDPLNGDLYVTTKRTNPSLLFVRRAPLSNGELEYVGPLPSTAYANMGGDISADGKLIALMRDASNDVQVWDRMAGQTVYEAFSNEPCTITGLNYGQSEAVAFDTDNSGTFYLLAEGGGARPIHKVERSPLTISVEWTPVASSLDFYYRVGWGDTEGVYTDSVNVASGAVTATVAVADCGPWFFAAKTCVLREGPDPCSEWQRAVKEQGSVDDGPFFLTDPSCAPPTMGEVWLTTAVSGPGS